MRHQVAFGVGLALISAGALIFRLPMLDNRPMHGDEAVHAFKFRELWETGKYRYDPTEYHGPTLYYATLPSVWLSGVRGFSDTTEVHYRIVTVVFGAATLLLLALFVDGLGASATLYAAALFALSPALVFYSRYYIQESLLAFFTLALLGSGWRYAQSTRGSWLLAAGACAGLMVATKETAVLTFAAIAVAALSPLARARQGTGSATGPRRRWSVSHALGALLVGVVTAILLLSGFLTNLSGPLGFLRSYAPWLHRAGSTDLHQHSWNYYLSILTYTHRLRGPVWSEGLIVGLAVVGVLYSLRTGISSSGPPQGRCENVGASSFTSMAAFSRLSMRFTERQVGLARFLAAYTVILTALYSLIPYKTPWCMVSFLHGMILLAGVGADAIFRAAPGRFLKTLVALCLLAATGHLAWLSYQTNYVYDADGRNPYVYAQPVPDILDLGARVEALSRVSPRHPTMVVKVISADNYYWPLPWYLRRLQKVGYWTRVPEDPGAPVVIASPRFDQELARRLDRTHQMIGYYGLRPRVVFEVWVETGLWQRYLQTRTKPRIPRAGEG